MDESRSEVGGRTFLSNRLRSFTGYLDPPAVWGGMKFFLPPFSVASHRVVKIGGYVWELWSPNSKQAPFFPGLKDPSIDVEKDLPKDRVRSDGHLGRFDPTLSPQHFDPSRPWLGFIRSTTSSEYAEHSSILSEWLPGEYPNWGSFKTSYIDKLAARVTDVSKKMGKWNEFERTKPELWKNRPKFPTMKDLDRMRGSLVFDEAVDGMARVQRGIKFMSAWCRMAQVMKNGKRGPIFPFEQVPPATSSIMGVWLNGCEKDQGLWLLMNQVPCFIIHAVESSNDMERIANVPRPLDSFVSGTPVAELSPECYSFDQCVAADGERLRDVTMDYAICPLSLISPSMLSDRVRSSPYGQGFRENHYVDPRLDSPVVPISSTTQTEERREPPAVADVTPNVKWTKWEEILDNNNEHYMAKRGKKFQPEEGVVYYDRTLCRYLYLLVESPIPPDYVGDPSVYGLPAPELPYFELVDKSKVNHVASRWMYQTEKPSKDDVGRVYNSLTDRRSPAPDPISEESDEAEGIVDTRSHTSNSPHSPPLEATPISRGPPPMNALNRSCQDPVYALPSLDRGRPPVRVSTIRNSSPSPVYKRRHSRSSSPRCASLNLDSVYRRRPSPPRRSFLSARDRHHSPSYERWSRRRTPTPPRRRLSPLPGLSNRNGPSVRRRSPKRYESAAPRQPTLPSKKKESFTRPSSSMAENSGSAFSLQESSLNATFPAAYVPKITSPVQRKAGAPPVDARSAPSAITVPMTVVDRLENRSAPIPTSKSLILRLGVQDADSEDENMLLDPPPPLETDMDTSEDLVGHIARKSLLPISSSNDLISGRPQPPPSILSTISSVSQTCFLCIWTLNFFVWEDVITWIQNISGLLTGSTIKRVVRTQDKGVQIFWLKFSSAISATAFRGIVAARDTADAVNIGCGFVDGRAYSAACSRSRDAWRPLFGLETVQSTKTPFIQEALDNIPLSTRLSEEPSKAQKKRLRVKARKIQSMTNLLNPDEDQSNDSSPLTRIDSSVSSSLANRLSRNLNTVPPLTSNSATSMTSLSARAGSASNARRGSRSGLHVKDYKDCTDGGAL